MNANEDTDTEYYEDEDGFFDEVAHSGCTILPYFIHGVEAGGSLVAVGADAGAGAGAGAELGVCDASDAGGDSAAVGVAGSGACSGCDSGGGAGRAEIKLRSAKLLRKHIPGLATCENNPMNLFNVRV